MVTYDITAPNGAVERHRWTFRSWQEWTDVTVTGSSAGFTMKADPDRGITSGYPEWSPADWQTSPPPTVPGAVNATVAMVPNSWMRPVPSPRPGDTSGAATVEQVRAELGLPSNVEMVASRGPTEKFVAVRVQGSLMPLRRVDLSSGAAMRVVSIEPLGR